MLLLCVALVCWGGRVQPIHGAWHLVAWGAAWGIIGRALALAKDAR
jgi:hypothetical protein